MLEFLLDGGVIMLPLVCLSVLSIAIIIDRIHAFNEADLDTEALRENVVSSLERGDLNAALSQCESVQGPVAAVLLAGLAKYRALLQLGRPPVESEIAVSKTMEDVTPGILAVLERRLNLLVMIASISPLLGMTGTVTGMIKSFNKLAETAGVDPSAVAGGISEALVTTAAGLVIAIPAVIAYNVFNKKVEAYAIEIENMITVVRDFITLRQRR